MRIEFSLITWRVNSFQTDTINLSRSCWERRWSGFVLIRSLTWLYTWGCSLMVKIYRRCFKVQPLVVEYWKHCTSDAVLCKCSALKCGCGVIKLTSSILFISLHWLWHDSQESKAVLKVGNYLCSIFVCLPVCLCVLRASADCVKWRSRAPPQSFPSRARRSLITTLSRRIKRLSLRPCRITSSLVAVDTNAGGSVFPCLTDPCLHAAHVTLLQRWRREQQRWCMKGLVRRREGGDRAGKKADKREEQSTPSDRDEESEANVVLGW